MMRRTMGASALGAVAVLALTVTAAPAAGAAVPTVKHCAPGEVLTHGYFDTLVADGVSCTASGVNVGAGGTFALNPGAALTVNASTLAGSVDVQGGSFGLTSSRITAGDLNPTTTGSVAVAHSYINGGIFDDNSGRWGQASSFTLTDSVIQTNVQMELLQPALRATVSGDRIKGMLAIRSGAVTVDHTSIGTVADFESPQSLQLCSLHVLGSMTISRSAAGGSTLLGLYAEEGHICTGGVTVVIDGSLTLTDNAGSINLSNVIVAGNLVCTGNATRPIEGLVIVGGARQGQCA